MMNREPARLIGALTAVLPFLAGVACLIAAESVPGSADILRSVGAALLGSSVLPPAVAETIRAKVYSPATAEDLMRTPPPVDFTGFEVPSTDVPTEHLEAMPAPRSRPRPRPTA